MIDRYKVFSQKPREKGFLQKGIYVFGASFDGAVASPWTSSFEKGLRWLSIKPSFAPAQRALLKGITAGKAYPSDILF
jgi:hypothetical protein